MRRNGIGRFLVMWMLGNVVLAEILEFVVKEGNGGISRTSGLEQELKSEFVRLAWWGETCWRQKSRATWLEEGDNNTKFVKKVAKILSLFTVWKIHIEEEILQRVITCENGSLGLNMGIVGASGLLGKLDGHMGCVCGRALGVDGSVSQVMLDLL